jgi:hypothetical protein
MKKIFSFLVALFSLLSLHAKPVNEATARKVGQHFLERKTAGLFASGSFGLNLAYRSISASENPQAKTDVSVYFYVFNADKRGFVIVSGDDIAEPVLGYSDEGAFLPENLAEATQKWLENYKAQIREAIALNLEANEAIRTAWENLLQDNGPSGPLAGGVTPLISTKWDQGTYYNALCPYDNSYSQRTVTGCVATAMAQIMKFWNYPATGSGFHSYNHSRYGTLSANFGNTTYNWSSMPNRVTIANAPVATLMYHCGVSIDMNYGVSATGGSGAQTLDVVDALKTYFGYPSSVQGLYRSNYTESQWKTVLKNELNAGRPVQYAGTGTGGGHSFVCDGYDNNDFFHFNWGWSGSSDGYFSVNALNPGSLGTGGGSGGFNSNQRAIIGISAPTVTQNAKIRLNKALSLSASSIYYGNSFSVSTNVVNNGTNSFSGDFGMAVFDADYKFVEFIETKTGYTLQVNYTYTNDLQFSTTGSFGLVPGTYYIALYSRQSGGNWVQASNHNSFTNLVSFNVINPDDIEVNAAITTNPVTATRGKSLTVNTNIRNDGSSTYVGQYAVNLYKLDGTFVETIATMSENNGLPAGYTYNSPFLNFSTSSLNAAPGTYLLAVMHKRSSSSSWQLTGSSYHTNPIKITVQAPGDNPDIYEVNNTAATAYTLPVTFSGNNANPSTPGSNCHNGTDYDFYRIALAPGFTYTLRPRLHDAYNSNNGNSYTLDALFSYSTDGSTWSDAFDDVLAQPLQLNGGSQLFIKVSPYFTGQTGTYLLDIPIARSATTGTVENAAALRVYPNPGQGVFTVETPASFQPETYRVSDAGGRTVYEEKVRDKAQRQHLKLSLPGGLYLLEAEGKSGKLSQKLILQP